MKSLGGGTCPPASYGPGGKDILAKVQGLEQKDENSKVCWHGHGVCPIRKRRRAGNRLNALENEHMGNESRVGVQVNM